MYKDLCVSYIPVYRDYIHTVHIVHVSYIPVYRDYIHTVHIVHVSYTPVYMWITYTLYMLYMCCKWGHVQIYPLHACTCGLHTDDKLPCVSVRTMDTHTLQGDKECN